MFGSHRENIHVGRLYSHHRILFCRFSSFYPCVNKIEHSFAFQRNFAYLLLLSGLCTQNWKCYLTRKITFQRSICATANFQREIETQNMFCKLKTICRNYINVSYYRNLVDFYFYSNRRIVYNKFEYKIIFRLLLYVQNEINYLNFCEVKSMTYKSLHENVGRLICMS